ncbi:hypothetical protein CANARDRAFT_5122 [[Candida] arabinofermentans NRRL YB-2248]|uniref:BAR domain-containing protein n=1 Tax=[Candida] arabinofermentans NRRL YB-2248 TaxID=983967 RepID=A0A1E4T7T0_9ASCO|nr:hypothetical protein CANARDRAFT_5122 [[Candida] arabinofermentans NRRL YB-2248]
MSWTGFKKAVNRAGAHVIMKTNKSASESVDAEFDIQEANFRKIEQYTNDLNQDLSQFIANFENLIEVQLNLVKTLDSFYGDYSFDLNADKKMDSMLENMTEDDVANESFTTGSSNTVNNRDGISLSYLKIVNEIKNDILPDLLKPLNVTVLEPMNELKNYNEEINKLIKKRGRKKIDYDILHFKMNKMQTEFDQLESQVIEQQANDKKDQLHKSLAKLEKMKDEFGEVESIYNDINLRLKTEIEQFVSMRLSLIDPTFESFIKIQVKLYDEIFRKTMADGKLHIDAMSVEEYHEEKIDDRLDEILLKMKSLDIKNL